MKKNPPRPRGRPRAFDRDEVLDSAMTTFWAHGYDGASIDILTESMGINRPSLYATFGSKRELFMEAIDRYAITIGIKPYQALTGDLPVKKAVANFFKVSIECSTTRGRPSGCLIANVATELAELDTAVQGKLAGMFADTEQAIANYFAAARDAGNLPANLDPVALARMAISVTHSIALRARAGASREDLLVMANDFVDVLFADSELTRE